MNWVICFAIFHGGVPNGAGQDAFGGEARPDLAVIGAGRDPAP